VHSHEMAVPERRKYIVHDALECNARVHTFGFTSLSLSCDGQEKTTCMYMAGGYVNNISINMPLGDYWDFGLCLSSGIISALKSTTFRKLNIFLSLCGVVKHLHCWVR
jgi:hypothetical protein